MGRLVASVLFGLAEMEHEYSGEEQAAGIAGAKRGPGITAVPRGRRKPSPPAPEYCMNVASPWRRLYMPCRSVRAPPAAI